MTRNKYFNELVNEIGPVGDKNGLPEPDDFDELAIDMWLDEMTDE